MIKKESAANSDRVRVTFELPSSMGAEQVSLVGEFNNWDPMATPLNQRHLDADWQVTLELEAGHRYRFRYLLNGNEWVNDWHADDYVKNPYGAYDSVVDLTKLGVASASWDVLLARCRTE